MSSKLASLTLLQVVLHPRSVFTLPGVWQGTQAFDGFGDAWVALSGVGGHDAKEDLSERLRTLVEECDNLQGECV
jgi:hypothetical protein